MDYRLVVGTGDPQEIAAASDEDAIARAIDLIRDTKMVDLRNHPESVVTLLGPTGLLTRGSERLDEFVERRLPANPAADPDRFQPGDSNTPDCNAD